ncbi:gamma-glutamyltransferase [soil metagenome]
MKKLLLAFVLLLQSAAAFAQGMVTSADPRATQAGQTILREGGSAADAAMAMMLALTVVEPQSSGIGGGGFLVHHDGKTGRMETIDGRETAPAAATPQRFLDAAGKPLPFGQAFQGGKSIGVPGNIRLMALAHRKWGKLPWKALFAPAIALAENGYQVTKPLNDRVSGMARIWGNFPEIAKQYSVDGKAPALGSTLKNPALAAILRRIADEGPEAFYTGENAKAIVAAATGTAVNASDITLADLTAYQAKERPPVCGFYRSYKICGMGPPSSGAVTVLGILGMLERFDLKKLGPTSPVAWHLIGEAMELAYADREKYLGDSDFVQVPVKGLIDPAYLAARSRLISPDKTLAVYEAGTPPGAQARTVAAQNEVPGTTHFIAVDKTGDIAGMTSTVEGPFGSQLLANGYVLNNELTDFTFAPEKDGAPLANRVEPGKRPLSSMAPTSVYDRKGKPIFTVGAAGGKTIIMQVTKALIAHLDWGMNARDSIGHGLIYFSGRTLILEKGTSIEPMAAPLERLGHQVVVSSLGLKANAAERTKTGWVGAADPRSVGTALSE